jgi:hypothetical protein
VPNAGKSRSSRSFASGAYWAFLAGAVLFLSGGCASNRPLSPVSAGTLAASLANERCQKTYGARPFHPEDFEAVMDNGRWRWGTPDGGKVDGYEVEISFDRTGRSKNVMVRIPEE